MELRDLPRSRKLGTGPSATALFGLFGLFRIMMSQTQPQCLGKHFHHCCVRNVRNIRKIRNVRMAEAVLHFLRGLWVRRAWASCCWIRNSFDENSEVPVSCTLCASGAVCSSCRSACRSQTVGCHLSVMTLTGGGAVSTRDGPNASEPRCVLGRRQRGGPKKTTSPKQAKGVQIHLEVSP